MNDAVSEAPSAKGSPDPGSGAIPETFVLHVSRSPPLAWLAALAALIAMAINQLLLPGLGKSQARAVLRSLERWGTFSTNLAVIAGLCALSFGLYAFVRYSSAVQPRQRMIVALLATLFLPTIAMAGLLSRQSITAQIVLLALGLSHMLAAHLGLCAARAARSRYAQALALLVAAMAISALLYQLLEQLSQVRIHAVQAQVQTVAQGLGEICYGLLLVGIAPLLLPTRSDPRSRLARAVLFFLLPVTLGSLYMAERLLDNDYALLLYHAQHVTLFIDSWPRLYSLPIGLATASSLAALLTSDLHRRQAALGALLLLASGYAPLAPGRLLTSALALLLIARAVIASAETPSRGR